MIQSTCEEVLDPPNGVLIEGFKYAAERVIEVTDNSICTMCDTGKSFGNCCKAVHNERLMKAHKKGAKLIYCQNVLERHHIVGNPPYVTHRIGLMNFHTTTFTLKSEKDLNEVCKYEIMMFSCIERK